MTTPTTSLTFSSIQTEFGGANPISISEYYKGGAYVPSGQATSATDGTAIPTSGAIRIGEFRGITKTVGVTVAMGITPSQVAGNANASGSVNATFSLLANGTCNGAATPITDTNDYSANWASPTTTGIGSSYWVRVTPTSGTFTSGTTGSWVSLSSGQAWSKNTTGSGTATVLYTLEISSSSSGTPVLVTKTGCRLQYLHNYLV